jgi:hypothetical protein
MIGYKKYHSLITTIKTYCRQLAMEMAASYSSKLTDSNKIRAEISY